MRQLRYIILFIGSTLFFTNIQGQGFDYNILCNLQQQRTPTMDNAMRWLSNSLILAPAIPAGMAIGGWAGGDKQLLHAAGQSGASFLATYGITMGLKAIIKRPRPYIQYADDLVPVTTERSFSFPSGHTSFAFSTATSLCLQYPRWYVVTPAMLWACGIGFSRMYLGVHYPTDVASGALIGILSAYITFQIQQRLEQQKEEAGLPQPKGVVIPISLTF